MTTVILSIIGILLAAISALMVVFYGGEAFQSSTNRSDAITIVNAMANLHAAGAIYQAENGEMAKWQQDLLGKGGTAYLSSMPDVPEGAVQQYIGLTWIDWSRPLRGKIWVFQIRKDVCKAIAEELDARSEDMTPDGDIQGMTCVIRDDIEPSQDNPGGGRSYAFMPA